MKIFILFIVCFLPLTLSFAEGKKNIPDRPIERSNIPSKDIAACFVQHLQISNDIEEIKALCSDPNRIYSDTTSAEKSKCDKEHKYHTDRAEACYQKYAFNPNKCPSSKDYFIKTLGRCVSEEEQKHLTYCPESIVRNLSGESLINNCKKHRKNVMSLIQNICNSIENLKCPQAQSKCDPRILDQDSTYLNFNKNIFEKIVQECREEVGYENMNRAPKEQSNREEPKGTRQIDQSLGR